MLTWIYRIIVVLVAVQVVDCMFREKSWKKQFNGVLVLIPFILRALMIK